MLNSILVATDMSARSELALQRARKLAEANNAKLTVCHIVDDAPAAEICELQRDAAERSLARFMGTLSETGGSELIVVTGDPTGTLLELIETAEPDLLVMGTHRQRAFLDALRETTAQRVARLTTCPVLIVTGRDDHDYDAVVAATDFSPAAAAAIRLAERLSPGVQITPVHAFHVPYHGLMSASGQDMNAMERAELRDAMKEDAHWREMEVLPESCAETVVTSGSVFQVLHSQINSLDATLIVAGAHGRVGQGRAMLGSIATDLMRMPPCDVLIARPR